MSESHSKSTSNTTIARQADDVDDASLPHDGLGGKATANDGPIRPHTDRSTGVELPRAKPGVSETSITSSGAICIPDRPEHGNTSDPGDGSDDELLYTLLLSLLPEFDFDEKVAQLEHRAILGLESPFSASTKCNLSNNQFNVEISGLLQFFEPPTFNPQFFDQLACLLRDFRCNAPAGFLRHLDLIIVGTYLFALAAFHHQRYQESRQHIELDKAIAASEKSVTILPEDGGGFEARIQALSNLSTFTAKHFQEKRDRPSLDASIAAFQKLTTILPDHDPRKSQYLLHLANQLQERFYCFFTLSDLDATVDALDQGLCLIPQNDSSIKTDILSSLGRALHSRYSYMGYINDIDSAIAVSERLMEHLGPHHPQYPSCIGNLATTLLWRYSLSEDIADLNKAIEILQRVTNSLENHDIGKQTYLETLATSLRMRYMAQVGESESSKDPSDLLLAIDAGQRAIDLAVDGPERFSKAQSLLNHGITCSMLSKCLDDAGNIDSAIALQKKAADLVPDDHPGKGKYLFSLGDSYFARFELEGNTTDAQEALNTFSMATYNDLTEASTRLLCATRMAEICDAHPELCNAHPNLTSPLHAHKLVLELIPKLVWLGSDVNHRHQRMAMVGTAVNNAVSAAIAAGDMTTAVEWMEQGRCIVWGQIIQLRSPLDVLLEKDASLATELTAVSRQLDQAGMPQHRIVHGPNHDSESYVEQNVSKRHDLATRYETLLAKARAVPGMETFMLPKYLPELRAAAVSGHAVLINVQKTRCDAMIVSNSSTAVMHVPLPNLKFLEIEKWYLSMFDLLKQYGVGVRGARLFQGGINQGDLKELMMGILGKLWSYVVQPILSCLELLSPADQLRSPLPRITWCTSGPLVFLPLHAAGIYDIPNQPKTFDYVVSSYTPTITALLQQPAKREQMRTRLLAISQPNTPHQPQLPGTESEMLSLTESLGESELCVLNAESATKDDVLREMAKHRWIHLACHAFQHSTDATKSGFILHDATLELIDVIKQSFTHTELAVLSACQTATGAKALPEEVVHLAAGMLIAGYRSVVGTMWSVGDQDAPIVMKKFYSYLMKDAGGDSKQSAYALHHAVKMLREEVGEQNFISWVPFIHMGV